MKITKQTIKKGNSYSFNFPRLHFGKTTKKGTFKLTEESKYPPHLDKPRQINKITGIAWGHHHLQSIRIGIVYNQDDTFTLYAYCYIKGNRYTEPITTVPVGAYGYYINYSNGVMMIQIYDCNNYILGVWNLEAFILPLPGYYLNHYHTNATADVSVYVG